MYVAYLAKITITFSLWAVTTRNQSRLCQRQLLCLEPQGQLDRDSSRLPSRKVTHLSIIFQESIYLLHVLIIYSRDELAMKFTECLIF